MINPEPIFKQLTEEDILKISRMVFKIKASLENISKIIGTHKTPEINNYTFKDLDKSCDLLDMATYELRRGVTWLYYNRLEKEENEIP